MKFQITELAKINKANINIKNLTIFVGKNSTNKSYMAHTVYMLNKILSQFTDSKYGRNRYIDKLFFQYIKDLRVLEILEQIKKLDFAVKEKEYVEQIDIDEYHTEFYREVSFDFGSIDTDSILLSCYQFILENIIQSVNESFNTAENILKKITFSKNKYFKKDIFKQNRIVIINDDVDTDHVIVLRTIFKKVALTFYNQKACKEEFYFPASRTGFVLTFDEIVSGVLRDRFGGQPTATKLTEPTIDFISGFADIKSGKFGDEAFGMSGLFSVDLDKQSKYKMKKLFEFIEDRIIKGKIIEDKKEQSYTRFYLQTNKAKKVDLHLTSSATVELLPLIIFLKHFSKIDDRLLVIEEPEAHLHPKAQIEMARLLVMLVNSGAKVLITTHSDYILSELSNCIKLYDADDNIRDSYLEKYKLDKNSIIDKNKISAYLFKDDKNDVEVKELKIGKFGISNENFDDILDELLERTEEINELIG